jgi:hypothetical protein
MSEPVRKKVEIYSSEGGSIQSWCSDSLSEILDDELDYCSRYNKSLEIIIITEAKGAL